MFEFLNVYSSLFISAPGRALSDAEDVHRRPNGQEQEKSDEPR